MASDQSDSQSTEQSPPPPSDSSSSSSPPPPSSDVSSSSPPPPPSGSQSSPPPPSDDQSSSPTPSDNQSSPPPPSDNDQSSPPSPSDSSAPPPPNQSPPSDNDSSSKQPSDDKSSPSPPTSSNDGGKQNSTPASSSRGSSGSPKQGSSPSPDKKQLGGDSDSSDKKQSGNKKSSKSSDDGLSTEAIARVAAGAAFLLAVMVLLIVCCIKKKRKKKNNAQHVSTRIDDNDYYNRAASPNMHGQPAGDHFVNIPPPPGAANKSWMATPPPQQNLTSSDMSSSAFSGPHGPPMPPPHPSVALGFNKCTFTYEELLAATGGFSQDNLLGQGGFGYVHKGVLPNGKEVAVKSLKATSGQGDREFQAEVDIISRVHHRHLVSLVGYCISGERRLLVYEFVPNMTLEHHLYGKDTSAMDWPTRLRIAIGSARGLAYLHEDCHPRIIHRDIKAANILLETNFDAKVADFGLAKLNQDNYTHVSTRVMGTFGYLAPEYASSGKLTEKSDVFSFGIMLLELITGRPPVDQTGRFEDSLVDWARPLCARALDTGDFDELVDPRLEDEYNREEMSCMVACAIASVRHSARRRPKMSQVVRTLEGDVSLDSLNEGLKPGGQASAVFSSDSSEYDSSSYDADMKKFKKLALGTENFASSDQYRHSGTSSDSMMSRR